MFTSILSCSHNKSLEVTNVVTTPLSSPMVDIKPHGSDPADNPMLKNSLKYDPKEIALSLQLCECVLLINNDKNQNMQNFITNAHGYHKDHPEKLTLMNDWSLFRPIEKFKANSNE